MSFIMPPFRSKLRESARALLLLALVLRKIRIRSTSKQPSAILERDGAGVGPEAAVFGLIAQRDHFGSFLEGFFGESPAQQDSRRTTFHHPIGHFTVRSRHI